MKEYNASNEASSGVIAIATHITALSNIFPQSESRAIVQLNELNDGQLEILD